MNSGAIGMRGNIFRVNLSRAFYVYRKKRASVRRVPVNIRRKHTRHPAGSPRRRRLALAPSSARGTSEFGGVGLGRANIAGPI